MLQKKPMRLLQVPSMQRCFLCRQYRFAIASQALIHQGTGKVHFRWICESCGRKHGLTPTSGFLSKKWQIQSLGNKVNFQSQKLCC